MKHLAGIFSLIFVIFFCSCSYGDEIFSEERGMHTYYGIKNSSGDIILEPVYKFLEKQENGYLARLYPKYSIYDLNGKKLLELPDSSIEFFSENMIIAKNINGYFFVDKKGKQLSKDYYDYLSPVFPWGLFATNTYGRSDDLLYPSFEGKIFNGRGEEVIPKISFSTEQAFFQKFDKKLFSFEQDGIIWYEEDGIYLIKPDGKKNKISKDEAEELEQLTDKTLEKMYKYFSCMCEDGTWRIETLASHKEVVPCGKYEEIFYNGFSKYFAYKKNNLWGVKDMEEKDILPPVFKEQIVVYDDYIKVNTEADFVYFDKNLKPVFFSNAEFLGNFSEGLVSVGIISGNKMLYGYMDEQGRMAVDFKYDYAGDFSDGLAVVGKRENRQCLFGFIDKKGRQTIDFRYNKAFPFSDGKAYVCIRKSEKDKSENCFYIDKTGNNIK